MFTRTSQGIHPINLRVANPSSWKAITEESHKVFLFRFFTVAFILMTLMDRVTICHGVYSLQGPLQTISAHPPRSARMISFTSFILTPQQRNQLVLSGHKKTLTSAGTLVRKIVTISHDYE